MSAATMARATLSAEEVYSDFLGRVIEARVVQDREGAASARGAQRVAAGTHIDARVLRLMAISGKGGWSSDPELAAKYARSTNTTLLDHLLSTARGALLLAACDWLNQNPEMDDARLRRLLAVIAVIAFLHDLDKDLGLARGEPLALEAVAERLERYGIADFLAPYDVALSAEQLRYLIEKVEPTQAHKHILAQPPPRELEALPLFVRLADKLDGAWLSSDPVTGGASGVQRRLREDEGCLGSAFLRDWRVIELFDPHHPFLLDELQLQLSLASRRHTGIPPLIETHHDGRLCVLLPEQGWETAVQEGVAGVVRRLPFQLSLTVSNRGLPTLQDGQPDRAGLRDLLAELPVTGRPLADLASLFYLKAPLKNDIGQRLHNIMVPLGLEPRWPKKEEGLLSPYAAASGLDEDARGWLRIAAEATLLLNLNIKVSSKSGVPDGAERERQLIHAIGASRPDWIEGIEDAPSRRAVTALWAAVVAREDAQAYDRVWGEAGVLRRWLEGKDETPGLRCYVPGRSTRIQGAVSDHLSQLLGCRRIAPQGESGLGRCLFTNEPVALDDTIDSALGLYGVRVSAFSGRDGRPETVTSERAHTNVGPVSIAEHKLRAAAHAMLGGGDDGVPVLLSCPTTSALFGGLATSDSESLRAMTLYDLNRTEVKKGRVLANGAELFRTRFRMARLERLGEKTADQVNRLRMLLQAARRVGRPMHLFRGLPSPQRAFFYFDAMPTMLRGLVGGNELRLEQFPEALKRLEIGQALLEEPGLGYEVLRLYASTKTRLRGLCLAWCGLADRDKKGEPTARSLLQEFLYFNEGGGHMNQDDGALVRLGRAAAGIQKRLGGGASASKQRMVFQICLDAVAAARAVGQTDRASLVYAVAGELEENLGRRGEAAAREHRGGDTLLEGCREVAELFVDEVWLGVLKGHSPSQSQRRVLGSIYRMAFLNV